MLHQAIQSKNSILITALFDHEAIQEFIKKITQKPPIPENIKTLLHEAVQTNDLDIVALLVNTGIIPNQPDEHDRYPLSYAAQQGNAAIFNYLVTLSNDGIDRPDKLQRTPLSYAAERGCLEIVQQLDPEQTKSFQEKDSYETTPYGYAKTNNHKEITDYCSRRNEPLDEGAIHRISYEDEVKLGFPRYYIQLKQCIDKKPTAEEREAAWGNAYGIFSKNKKYDYLLHKEIYQAIEQNKPTAEIIEKIGAMQDSALLGNHGPVLTFNKVEIKPLSIIEYARNNGKQDLLTAIFNRNTHHDDFKKLELAIACNQKEYVEQHKRQFPEHASSLFHYAIRCGQTSFAEIFLNEIPEKERQTSYQQARKLVHPFLPSTESVNAWLDSVQMTGLTEKEKEVLDTIFFLAGSPRAPSHNIRFHLRDLQNNLAALNNKDKDGKTPLMLAATELNSEIIEMLIAAGADPDIKDNEGKNAHQLYSEEREKYNWDLGGTIPKTTPENRLELAVKHGLFYVVETLLKENPKLIKNKNNLLKLLQKEDNHFKDYANIKTLLDPQAATASKTLAQQKKSPYYERNSSFSSTASSVGPSTPSTPGTPVSTNHALQEAARLNNRTEITRLMVSGQRFDKNESVPGDFRTRHHILKLSIKLDHKISRYKHHTQNITSNMGKAKALLESYANGGGIKHHRKEVKDILARIDGSQINNLKDLLPALKEIKLENQGGSLARRMAFIENELMSQEPQQSNTPGLR